MIVMVISGGQEGADQAGLRAARACGIATGGWAPQGWLVEDLAWQGRGHRPDIAAPWLAEFGLCECDEPGYPARRRRNAAACDAALLFGDAGSHGSKGLIGDMRRLGKPLLHVQAGTTTPSDAIRFLRDHTVKILLVAGNRESAAPGIGARTERFLKTVFGRL